MRLSRLQTILFGLLGLPGLALLILALLASPLGLAQGTSWGRARLLLAGTGGALVLLAGLVAGAGWICRLLAPPAIRLAKVLGTAWGGLKALPAARQAGRLVDLAAGLPVVRLLFRTDEHSAQVLTGTILALALFGYVFYQTAGKMTEWPYISDYYDMQAEAFLKGQTALQLDADPRLAQLANPYDYRQREAAGVRTPWDVSYYQGKYYLYWGPVPAFPLAAAKLGGAGVIDDQFLVFFFLAGLEIASAALLLAVRRRFFPALPTGGLAVLLLAIVFANPIPYVLNRPSVYEAAILSGQFFLVSGILAAFTALAARRPEGWLLLAGLCWALAGGSRINLLGAIACVSLVFGWQAWRLFPARRLALTAALALPLAAGLAGLGWYNAARFGSPFDTGNRYQLTGEALPEEPNRIISPLYAPPNLYNYLARPLQITPSFPFLNAPWVTRESWPGFIPIPASYYSIEPVSGVAGALPFGWLAWLALLPMLTPAWPWLKSAWGTPGPVSQNWAERELAGLLLALVGSAGLALAPLLVFISASMRYELDFLPTLGLAAAVAAGWGSHKLASRPAERRWFKGLVAGLSLLTAGMGLLLGFSGYTNRIEALNPGLYYGLMNLFGK
jgi:hypothetical protein